MDGLSSFDLGGDFDSGFGADAFDTTSFNTMPGADMGAAQLLAAMQFQQSGGEFGDYGSFGGFGSGEPEPEPGEGEEEDEGTLLRWLQNEFVRHIFGENEVGVYAQQFGTNLNGINFGGVTMTSGGGSGGSISTPPLEPDISMPCPQTEGLIDFFRDLVGEILDSTSRDFEYGALLYNDNGNVGLYRGAIYTDSSTTSVDHPFNPDDAPNIVSIIHNHPSQGGGNIDLENRYPSDTDWAAGEALVNAGADPNTLTLVIVDPNGDARVFNYSDRDQYENMSARDMRNGKDLPSPIPDDADNDPCVSIPG